MSVYLENFNVQPDATAIVRGTLHFARLDRPYSLEEIKQRGRDQYQTKPYYSVTIKDPQFQGDQALIQFLQTKLYQRKDPQDNSNYFEAIAKVYNENTIPPRIIVNKKDENGNIITNDQNQPIAEIIQPTGGFATGQSVVVQIAVFGNGTGHMGYTMNWAYLPDGIPYNNRPSATDVLSQLGIQLDQASVQQAPQSNPFVQATQQAPVQQGNPFQQAAPQQQAPVQQGNPFQQAAPQQQAPVQQGNPFQQAAPQQQAPVQQGNPFQQAIPQQQAPVQQGDPFQQGNPFTGQGMVDPFNQPTQDSAFPKSPFEK